MVNTPVSQKCGEAVSELLLKKFLLPGRSSSPSNKPMDEASRRASFNVESPRRTSLSRTYSLRTPAGALTSAPALLGLPPRNTTECYQQLGWDAEHERLVTVAFFTVGVGLLCPYNALISCVDVFADKFGPQTAYYVAGATIAPNVLTLALSVAFGFPGSPKARVVGGLAILLAICASVPFCESLAELIVLSCLVGLIGSVVQGSMFALAGRCTGGHTSAVSSGTSLAGIIVCAIRVATKGAAPSTTLATYLYFGAACVLLLLAIAAYILVIDRSSQVQMFIVRSTPAARRKWKQQWRKQWRGSPIPRLQWSQSEGVGAGDALGHHRNSNGNRGRIRGNNDSGNSSSRCGSNGGNDSEKALLRNDYLDSTSARLIEEGHVASAEHEDESHDDYYGYRESNDHRSQSADYSSAAAAVAAAAAAAVDDDDDDAELPPWEILRVIWAHAATVFGVMFASIFIFPGFVTQMSPNQLPDHWWPVILVSAFNVGDFSGRMLTSVPGITANMTAPGLLTITLLRGAVFIAAGLAAVLPLERPLLGTPYVEVMVVLLLGFTGGFFATCAMLLAPLTLPETSRARAGAAMTFFLLLGATIGSFAGIIASSLLG